MVVPIFYERKLDQYDPLQNYTGTRLSLVGTDAPLCQDTRSGGLDELLASANIGYDSLVDLASEKTFEAPDDLPFGSDVRRAACDVINDRLMVPHADDDRSIKGGVGVAVAAPIEPVLDRRSESQSHRGQSLSVRRQPDRAILRKQ